MAIHTFAQNDDLVREAAMMTKLRHPNIVQVRLWRGVKALSSLAQRHSWIALCIAFVCVCVCMCVIPFKVPIQNPIQSLLLPCRPVFGTPFSCVLTSS